VNNYRVPDHELETMIANVKKKSEKSHAEMKSLGMLEELSAARNLLSWYARKETYNENPPRFLAEIASTFLQDHTRILGSFYRPEDDRN